MAGSYTDKCRQTLDMSRPYKGQGMRFDKCSLVLALLVAGSLVMSLVTFALFFNRANKTEETGICVPCANVIGHDSDPDTMELYDSLTKSHNTEKCCANNKMQTSNLVQLISKKLSRKSPAIGLKHHLSAAFAQKSLTFLQKERVRTNEPRIDKDKRYYLTIDTRATDTRYELKHEVNLTADGITIIHPGLYFVYKSINFMPDSNKPCKTFGDLTFKSFLVKNKANDRTDLLRNEHTCCPDCIHNSETGFSGGVFQLEKGDIIQVAVTNYGLIQVSKDVTYVGLMMMNSKN